MASRARGDELISTVEAVYAAGLDAGLWPQALAAVTHLIGGVGTAFEVFDRRTFAHHEFHSFGLAPAGQRAYLEHYAPLNPRFLPALRSKPGELSLDYLVIDEREMDRSPFYAEFLAPQNLRYTVGCILATPKDECGVVAVQRSPRQGHGQRAEIALMQRLAPHVGKAWDMGRRLAGADAGQRPLQGALELLTDAAVLIGADGAVIHGNEAFQAIVGRNDGVTARNRSLAFSAADANHRLAAALAAIHRPHDGGGSPTAAFDFPASRPMGSPPYLVSLRPLPRHHRPDRLAKSAAAVVFIRDPLSRNPAAIRMLRETLGLTDAEAGLAQAVRSGMSPGDYAREHAVSVNTVYTHLRRIKEKTGCHRMAELIRRLNDLQVPLRLD
jgi:DNA-binding CsgD family transcriptional regulator